LPRHLDKLLDPNALAAYALQDVDSVQGMFQSGAVSVLWSAMELQDEYGISGDVAEIGVHHGKLLIMLCLGLNLGERAIAVEIFGNPPGSNSAGKEQFLANMARFGIGTENFELFMADSTLITSADWQSMTGGNVRLFSVDGDHSKEAVLSDLALAEKAINAEGLIIADDLFNPWYPTVTEAIYDYFKGDPKDLQPVAFIAANGPVETGASKLLIARAPMAGRYKSGLKLLNQDNLKHCDPFAGFKDVPSFYFEGLPSKRPLDDAMRDILNDIATPS